MKLSHAILLLASFALVAPLAAEPEHDHSAEVRLAPVAVGEWTITPALLGELTPGGEAHADFIVAGPGDYPAALRVWIGDELADQTGKFRVEREAAGRGHGHVEVPQPLDPAYHLWIEVEHAGQKTRASVPLPGAEHDHDHAHGHDDAHHGHDASGSVTSLGEGRFRLSLRDAAGEPLGADGLLVEHDHKLHLVAIDGSLTDYHHVHPSESAPGEWDFAFDPAAGGEYRFFATFVPAATKAETLVVTQLALPGETPSVDSAMNNTATVDGYRFDAEWFPAPTAGGESRLAVRIANADGSPASLEPIMGAYAHIVAIDADRTTFAHVHPLGAPPKQASDRGGPLVGARVMTAGGGFHRVFVQVMIDGKVIVAPFGVDVAEASSTPKDDHTGHDHEHGGHDHAH